MQKEKRKDITNYCMGEWDLHTVCLIDISDILMQQRNSRNLTWG